MEWISNFFKNALYWIIFMCVMRIIYDISMHFGQTNPTLWGTESLIETVGTIVFGALIFSAHDWWLEKKAKSNFD